MIAIPFMSCISTPGTTGAAGSSSSAQAARAPVVYFIDSVNGNDASDGKSVDTPWKSLAALATLSYIPGDSIHLKRGSSFTSEIVIHQSGEKTNSYWLIHL